MKSDKVPAWACGRCETYEGVDSTEVTLFGGVHARLCIKCRNEWGDRLNPSQEWAAIGRIDTEEKALLAMSEQPGADYRRDLEVLRTQRDNFKQHFRELGKKFMEEVKVEASKP